MCVLGGGGRGGGLFIVIHHILSCLFGKIFFFKL